MNRIKTALVSIAAVFAFAAVPVLAVGTTVQAQTPKAEICKGINNGATCNQSGTNNLSGYIGNIVNILLFIIGAVAVIMIIIGGLRYVLSGGDSSSIKSAKDTILYAVIGLIVAISAYAIVNFVVLKL
jgi:hypothetical protein